MNSIEDDENELAEAIGAIESNLNIGLHEAIHVVTWRATGEDIVEVKNQDDRVVTIISMTRSLDEWDAIAIMAPEVYMTSHGIAFTENSVSDDRASVNRILEGRENPNKFKSQVWRELEIVLMCPHILRAIEVLSPLLDNIETIGVIPGERIHQLIDPILLPSAYSLGLKELLRERSQIARGS